VDNPAGNAPHRDGHGREWDHLCFPALGYTELAMPVLDDTALMTLVAAGILAIVAIGLVLVRRHGQRLHDRLAPAFDLGTSRRASIVPPAVEGLFHGYTCRYAIEQRSQYSAGGGNLRIRAASPLRWSASRKGAGATLLAAIGILKDLTIGDEELDRQLRLASGDAPALISLLGQLRTRDALRALAATEGFASIRVRAQRTDLEWKPRRPELDESPEVLRRRLSAAVELLAACGCPPLIE
jgi:hypothetical protein